MLRDLKSHAILHDVCTQPRLNALAFVFVQNDTCFTSIKECLFKEITCKKTKQKTNKNNNMPKL